MMRPRAALACGDGIELRCSLRCHRCLQVHGSPACCVALHTQVKDMLCCQHRCGYKGLFCQELTWRGLYTNEVQGTEPGVTGEPDCVPLDVRR
jgi:hypothetical protein